MQIRPKTYLHFISLWRSLRDAIPPHHGDLPAETSPSLIYTAVVLASLLTILEADAHRGELESIGLLRSDYPIQAVFLSP
jgi:ABC-type transport system involved in cytochrome c biogenesis permease component